MWIITFVLGLTLATSAHASMLSETEQRAAYCIGVLRYELEENRTAKETAKLFCERQEGTDIPTLKEQGVDVELANWRGVFGAPGLAPDKQAALIGLIDKMVQGPTWQAELKKKDWTGIYLPGAEFGKYLDSEIARITGILKDLGLAT
jgi:putative tricarboxylic transport membrane protein